MKKFTLYSLLSILCCFACSSEEDVTPQVQQLPVNYANIAGKWELVSFNDNALAEGTYVSITLTRREHTFEMRDNLNSKYGQTRTGKYTLTVDDKSETTILSGTYDNGVGPWAHEYTVTSLTDDQLQLSTTDTPHEVQTFARVDQ